MRPTNIAKHSVGQEMRPGPKHIYSHWPLTGSPHDVTGILEWAQGRASTSCCNGQGWHQNAKLDNCLQSRAPLSHFFLACDVSLGSNIWFHVKGKSKLFHDFAMLQAVQIKATRLNWDDITVFRSLEVMAILENRFDQVHLTTNWCGPVKVLHRKRHK